MSKNFSIKVIEKVTLNNFYSPGYLKYNYDLRNVIDLLSHFKNFGYKENRFQFTKIFLEKKQKYQKEKFDKFKEMFFEDFVKSFNSFPILNDKINQIKDYAQESSNDDYEPFIQYVDLNPNGLFLDIGSGLRKFIRNNVLYTEVYNSITADVVLSDQSYNYPFVSNSFDGVGCFAVLEHVRRPWELVKEIQRILKPGGKVFVDWPFLQPFHGYPSHYFNATSEGLRSIFQDNNFEISMVKSHSFQGPNHTITWILNEFFNSLNFDLKKKILDMKLSKFIELKPNSPEWIEIISQIDEKSYDRIACGNCLIGKKKI